MTYIEQEQEALRLINKYGKPWMLKDSEAIGEIINTVINCRMKHNPERTKFSSYLVAGVKNKIAKLNKKRYKLFMIEIPENLSVEPADNTILDFIENTSAITDDEKKLLKRYYYDKYTLEEISVQLGLTRQRIQQRLATVISKLKGYKDVLTQR